MCDTATVHCNRDAAHQKLKLSNVDLNVLHHIAVYLIRSISKLYKCCKQCILVTGNLKPSLSLHHKLTSLRCYEKEILFFANQRTLINISNMQSYNGINLRKYFIKKFRDIPFFSPNCHNLRIRIIRRFAIFRLKVYFKARRSTSKHK
ncbi:uncharacterized protein LOC113464336 [Ceratina calcarata]|uniref:Uncharacterized protein LOC113464336 n=1 Tax=Ceratina calcarata TaxID=156304 RepID=A0AAJ7WAS0_9HYME|nr:uncharacterized protein LOC113464336 [Ceratina calcarata]